MVAPDRDHAVREVRRAGKVEVVKGRGRVRARKGVYMREIWDLASC